MSTTVTTPRPSLPNLVEKIRSWLTPLNLHFAGVAVLALANIYLLVHLIFLWQKASSNDAQALAQQQITLKVADAGAEPLRGLDTKLAQSTTDADRFYQKRLPSRDSEVLAELGNMTKQNGVRLTRGQYLHAPVLAGTPGELTEMRIDTSFSGDYRPLVQVINSLERDRMFFLIDAVTLSGQQSGTVNLRLSLRTYLRGHVESEDDTEHPADEKAGFQSAADQPANHQPETSGGPQR